MDGHFVPNLTIGPDVVASLRKYSKKPFDVHLMLSEPGRYIDRFISAGADIIAIHHEIEEDRIDTLRQIKALGCKAGIVYNPDTDLAGIDRYFPHIDQILLMSVHPGFGNQSFIEATLERGKWVANKLKEKGFPNIDLEIDGGISPDNSSIIKQHGFNILVSGSGVFNASNREKAIRRIKYD